MQPSTERLLLLSRARAMLESDEFRRLTCEDIDAPEPAFCTERSMNVDYALFAFSKGNNLKGLYDMLKAFCIFGPYHNPKLRDYIIFDVGTSLHRMPYVQDLTDYRVNQNKPFRALHLYAATDESAKATIKHYRHEAPLAIVYDINKPAGRAKLLQFLYSYALQKAPSLDRVGLSRNGQLWGSTALLPARTSYAQHGSGRRELARRALQAKAANSTPRPKLKPNEPCKEVTETQLQTVEEE